MRAMPHSIAAERSVLGAVLVKPECFPAVNVSAEHFFDPRSRAMWQAFRELAGAGMAIDVTTVEHALQRMRALDAVGGLSYVAELALTTPTADNVEHYARIVREHAKTREVMLAASAVVEAGYSGEAAGDDLLARLNAAARSVRPASDRRAMSARDLAGARMRELVAADEQRARGENPGRILTGLPIDERIGGLPRGNHCGLVAQTGHGKTATLQHIALNAPCPTLTFCFEELARDATDRLLSKATHIDGVRIGAGQLTSSQIARLVDAADKMPSDRYFVDARGMSDEQVVRFARLTVPALGIGLVQVDYLNRVIFSASSKLRTDERMRHALAIFDDACGELDVAWLTAAQVNRSPGKESRIPRLDDAHECAALEQYSKVGLVVYRPHIGSTTHDDDEIWVVIDKANIGGRFVCECAWHGPTMTISHKTAANAAQLEF